MILRPTSWPSRENTDAVVSGGWRHVYSAKACQRLHTLNAILSASSDVVHFTAISTSSGQSIVDLAAATMTLMSSTMVMTGHRIHELPNEVLEQIMLALKSPTDLQALITVDFQAKKLFQARPQAVLQTIMENCKPDQIQRLAGAVICRHIKPLNAWDSGEVDVYLYRHLISPIQPSLFGPNDIDVSAMLDHGLALLQKLANLFGQVEIAVTSFIATNLPKLANRILRQSWKECPSEESLEQTPSPTEVHRIRRAFWRLILYFEMHHSLDRREDIFHWKQATFGGRRPGGVLFTYFPLWEIAEMDCAYHHLKSQKQLWRKACPKCKQMVLPESYSVHVNKQCHRTWWDNPHPSYEELRGMYEESPIYEYSDLKHMFREYWNYQNFHIRKVLTRGAPEVEKPTASWRYYDDISERLHDTHTECFLDWGLYMWDQDRLERCQLIDNEAKNLVGQSEH